MLSGEIALRDNHYYYYYMVEIFILQRNIIASMLIDCDQLIVNDFFTSKNFQNS